MSREQLYLWGEPNLVSQTMRRVRPNKRHYLMSRNPATGDSRGAAATHPHTVIGEIKTWVADIRRGWGTRN